MAKGAVSVWLAERLTSSPAAPAAAGLAAIVGHIYPLWLHFRGGKGVATACGVFLVVTPLAVPPALAIFTAAVWFTKYISLGSLLATLALPPIAYALGQPVVRRRWRERVGRDHRVPASIERRADLDAEPSGGLERAPDADRRPFSAPAAGAPRWPSTWAASATTCTLWARDQALVDDMAARRANAVYLPDVTLPTRSR